MKKWALVVDDDEMIRSILPPLLEAYHYTVEATHSAESALEIISLQRFDVVITDYEMPGLNGLDLAKAVRERSPASRVILMTGRPASELFVGSGADGFLQKPFTADTLKLALDGPTRTRGVASPD